MIKFQTETTDISRNIGIEMGKNGWYPAKDGYFRCVGAWCGDRGRRWNDA